MSNHVIILGGGVAGMSAAHELIDRGFRVTVYERKPVPGGKARSIDVPNSGTDGRRDLPGEHGFRFFPRFYKHLPDTMSRIPYGSGSCADNLVQTTRIEMAQYGKSAGGVHLALPAQPGRSEDGVQDVRGLEYRHHRARHAGLRGEDVACAHQLPGAPPRRVRGHQLVELHRCR